LTIPFAALMVALLQATSAPLPQPPPPAPSSSIVVLVPTAATPTLRDALGRLRGEAESVGFAMQLVESGEYANPTARMQEIAATDSPAAVVALVEREQADTLGAIDVWFLDCATGGSSLGHLLVESDAGDRAELLLAVRVVDFIRARMFDSLVRSSAKAQRKPLLHHEPLGRHFVAVGFGATGSFSGLPTSFMPSIEAGLGLRPWLKLSIRAQGFGSKPRRENRMGSATIDEKLILLSANLRGRAWWRFFPSADLGVSALFLSGHGEGRPGYLGHDQSAWSQGLFATVGGGVVLGPHLQLLIAGGATMLRREAIIYVNDSEVARTGRPAWLGNVALGVSF
jgi:hypothetical protein